MNKFSFLIFNLESVKKKRKYNWKGKRCIKKCVLLITTCNIGWLVLFIFYFLIIARNERVLVTDFQFFNSLINSVPKKNKKPYLTQMIHMHNIYAYINKTFTILISYAMALILIKKKNFQRAFKIHFKNILFVTQYKKVPNLITMVNSVIFRHFRKIDKNEKKKPMWVYLKSRFNLIFSTQNNFNINKWS